MSGSRIPLFPLGLVLYPGEPVPLHIFEPRYREMVRVCTEGPLPFGVVFAQAGDRADVGCTARVARVLNRYDDGRLDILCIGVERFRIVTVREDEEPYLLADVVPFPPPDRKDDPEAPQGARDQVIAQHMKLLELAGETIRPALYEVPGPVSFVVARNAGLELDQKQALLEMTSEGDRLGFLADHFQATIQRVEQGRKLRQQAQGDGHWGGTPEL